MSYIKEKYTDQMDRKMTLDDVSGFCTYPIQPSDDDWMEETYHEDYNIRDLLVNNGWRTELVGRFDHIAMTQPLDYRRIADMELEKLARAIDMGINIDRNILYVLFDTWFSNPAQLLAVKKPGLESIAMIKKNPRIYYEYEGEQLSIDKIYGICKKRRGRSKYLLSVNVMVGKGEKISATLFSDEFVMMF